LICDPAFASYMRDAVPHSASHRNAPTQRAARGLNPALTTTAFSAKVETSFRSCSYLGQRSDKIPVLSKLRAARFDLLQPGRPFSHNLTAPGSSNASRPC
jgi:hypothetical protein